MPSKTKVSQRASGNARLCHKSKTSVSVDAPPSRSLDDQELSGNTYLNRGTEQEKLHTQQSPSAQSNGVAMDGHQVLLRSASQKSVSTDEGSSLSGYSSSSPVHSEGSTSFPPHSQPTPSKPHAQDKPRADLSMQVCTPHAPLWVGNGLKGDEAAWLLVLPKFPGLCTEDAKHDKPVVPKSPKDAVLLGPYVTTKNTFLEETRVGGGIRLPQRPRAQSLNALR